MTIYCQGCCVQGYTIRQLTTRYRVAQRTLSDSTLGTSHTFHYEYDGAATNDAAHSAAVAEKTRGDTELLSPPYSEYRGHAAGREIGPADGSGRRRRA